MIKNDITQGILERRSIRSFKSEDIPQDVIETLLTCMEAAPSAGNVQPWGFYLIKNNKIKKQLFELSFNQKPLIEAPIVVGITAKPSESEKVYGDLGKDFFCIQDTACVAQNLQLAAHSLGYASVWIGIVKEKEINQVLDVSKNEKIVALVAIGKPNEEAGPYERKSWKEITKILE